MIHILVTPPRRHPAGNRFPTEKQPLSDFSFHPARLARRVHSLLSVRKESPRPGRLCGWLGVNRSELASVPSVLSGPRSLGEESRVSFEARAGRCPILVVWSPVPNPPSPVLGEIAMNTGNSPSAGLSCGVTLHDLGLCTVPVGILVASILTLL